MDKSVQVRTKFASKEFFKKIKTPQFLWFRIADNE
jgi:hypothetical protein